MNENLQGWINLYKPKGMSSFSAIYKVKKKFDLKKVGHAGTLDPNAEGILPVAVNKATKLIPFINSNLKEYYFKIKWGQQTSTDDAEGEIIKSSYKIPSDENIVKMIDNFVGNISQVPPKASAININGRRAYALGIQRHLQLTRNSNIAFTAIRVRRSHSRDSKTSHDRKYVFKHRRATILPTKTANSHGSGRAVPQNCARKQRKRHITLQPGHT